MSLTTPGRSVSKRMRSAGLITVETARIMQRWINSICNRHCTIAWDRGWRTRDLDLPKTGNPYRKRVRRSK